MRQRDQAARQSREVELHKLRFRIYRPKVLQIDETAEKSIPPVAIRSTLDRDVHTARLSFREVLGAKSVAAKRPSRFGP